MTADLARQLAAEWSANHRPAITPPTRNREPTTTKEPRPTSGWPADSGPLESLRNLGLIPTDGGWPKWLRQPRHITTPTDGTIYRASALFLNGSALRDLAALTLEGWHVSAMNRQESIEIKVWATT